MPVLHLKPRLFAALRDSYELAAGVPEAPLDPALLDAVRQALARAKAEEVPGLPIVVPLTEAELAVLAACFEVGATGLNSISDDELATIAALLGRAAQSANPRAIPLALSLALRFV